MSELGFMDAALRAARPRAMGALLRYFRELDTAEEAFQEACLAALKHWPQNGPPRDFFGVKGGLLMQLKRADEARAAFNRAIALANSAAEAAHIRMQLDLLIPPTLNDRARARARARPRLSPLPLPPPPALIGTTDQLCVNDAPADWAIPSRRRVPILAAPASTAPTMSRCSSVVRAAHVARDEVLRFSSCLFELFLRSIFMLCLNLGATLWLPCSTAAPELGLATRIGKLARAMLGGLRVGRT